MSTALSIQNSPYSRVDPMQFINEVGQAIAASQVFGEMNASSGKLFALACLNQRCDPLTLPRTWHVIKGRLSMRADAALARLSSSGGRYEIVERTHEAATIFVEYKGRKVQERLTWEEAKQEPFVYDGGEKEVVALLCQGKTEKLRLKAKYATPRSRTQMLWARVVSDAIRTAAPEIISGMYTPEEVGDFTNTDTTTLAEQMPKSADVMEQAEERTAIQTEPLAGETTSADGDVIDAAFEIAEDIVQTAIDRVEAKLNTPPVMSRNMAAKIDEQEVAALKRKVSELSAIIPDLPATIRALFESQGLKFADLSWSSAEELRRKLDMKELTAMAGLMLQRGN